MTMVIIEIMSNRVLAHANDPITPTLMERMQREMATAAAGRGMKAAATTSITAMAAPTLEITFHLVIDCWSTRRKLVS